MYIDSGRIKANKKDIQEIRVFLEHAKRDMAYGGNGTYSKSDSLDNELDIKELTKGEMGLLHIEFILKRLCDKWEA